MRGSAEIAAAADMAYACEKQANGLYSLSCTKGRLIADEDSLSATVEIRDVDGVTMVRTLDASSRSQVITADIRSKVIQILGDRPGISVNDLEQVMGVRASTLRETLTSLEAGRVVSFVIGARRAKLYSLSGLL
jgi:ribosomal protein S25